MIVVKEWLYNVVYMLEMYNNLSYMFKFNLVYGALYGHQQKLYLISKTFILVNPENMNISLIVFIYLLIHSTSNQWRTDKAYTHLKATITIL